MSAFAGLLVACSVLVAALRPRRPRPFASSARRGPRRVADASPPVRARSRCERQLDAAMPDLLDLLVVSLQAGLPVAEALATIRRHAPDVVVPAIDVVLDRVDRGARLIDAIVGLVDVLGTRALALVAAIGATERDGLPLTPTLDRLADDARAHRRRAAEIDARRIPVRLAVPLVCCTLPSFVCIAIGPLLVGALSSLRSV